jgi:antitoxin ParD1/3/4
MEVQIAPYYDMLIKKGIESGKYNSEAEVIQAGLELLDKETKQLLFLEKAIMDGEKSGFAVPFDNAEFKKRMQEKYAK